MVLLRLDGRLWRRIDQNLNVKTIILSAVLYCIEKLSTFRPWNAIESPLRGKKPTLGWVSTGTPSVPNEKKNKNKSIIVHVNVVSGTCIWCPRSLKSTTVSSSEGQSCRLKHCKQKNVNKLRHDATSVPRLKWMTTKSLEAFCRRFKSQTIQIKRCLCCIF